MPLAPGLVIAGKYQLERPLAKGGMGSVWVAHHTQLKVALAIKFMEPMYAGSSVGRARFEREATASAQIRHPNVVHVQDYGVEGGMPYIVMELLVGEDLGKRLKRHRKLSIEACARILAQAAKALRRAHEAGFLHRDLKPGNIFLARSDDADDGETVKILDFGIAKQLGGPMGAVSDGESTKTGEIVGSPSYMSPEQIRGAKDIDARCDVWSLGVILYRCLTGQLPFPGETTMDIIARILTAQVPRATQLAPELSAEADAFFERALAHDRNARFGSVRELAEAFAAMARMPSPSMIMPAPSDMPPASSSHAFGPAAPPHSSPSPFGPSSSVGPSSGPFDLTPNPGSYPVALHPSTHPAAGINGQRDPGATDPQLYLRSTMKQPPRLPDALPSGGAPSLGESPTIAPSAGTLTVSPSITGSDLMRPAPRRPFLPWVVGGGTLFGVVLALLFVLGGKGSDAPAAGGEEAAASAAPVAATPQAPRPTEVTAPTAEPSVTPLPSASAAASASAKEAKSKAAAAPTTKSTGTKPAPTPTVKKKDWGI